MGKPETEDVLDDADAVEDSIKEVEDDEADADADADDDEEEDEDEEEEEEVEEADVVEQTESQDVERVKEKRVEAKKPLQMIGVQLLKDSDQTTSSKKSRRKASRIVEVWKLVVFQLIIQHPCKVVLVEQRLHPVLLVSSNTMKDSCQKIIVQDETRLNIKW